MPRYAVSVTTDASGNATARTNSAVEGEIMEIRYVPGASPLDTGADITISGDVSGIPIVTITNLGTSAVTVAPRQAVVDTANAARLYAAGGTAVSDRIYIADEAVKIVVAQGGNVLSGTFHIVVG